MQPFIFFSIYRVTLIPMETTLYDSENSHTEKQPFWKKADHFFRA